jgi:hypothetical protein
MGSVLQGGMDFFVHGLFLTRNKKEKWGKSPCKESVCLSFGGLQQ